MKILVTGSKGMVGRALVNNLNAVKDRKNKKRSGIRITDIFEYDIDSTPEELDEYCSQADFVFNLAGVNRPEDPDDFMRGNFGFASELLETLKKHDNKATVMLSSTLEATLAGKFANSEYGRSKKAGEELFFKYGEENDVKVAVYRFPNLMGPSRPRYNSIVSTICYAIANDLPYKAGDKNEEIELLYIDDLVEGMFDLLEGKEERCEYDGMEASESMFGRYCYIPNTYKTTLGYIIDLLETFKLQPITRVMPEMPRGSFEQKLYSLYLRYIPQDGFKSELGPTKVVGGSITEIANMLEHGRVSVSTIAPGTSMGAHWHNTKWEMVIAVSGKGKITEKDLNTDAVVEVDVSGDKLESVYMIPGWIHSVKNMSDTENLVIVLVSNESLDASMSDTYAE